MNTLFHVYCQLRRRTGYDRPNFFVTNRGEKSLKFMTTLTKFMGRVCRRPYSGAWWSPQGCHKDGVADRFYRLTDASEALRRNESIGMVDHTP